VLSAAKAHRVLGYNKRNMASKWREGILPLYSAPMRPHLQYCIQLWTPQHREDLSYEERLRVSCEKRRRELGLFNLEKRRLRGDTIATFQYLKEAYKKAGEGPFKRACSNRTRDYGFKLKEGRFILDIRKKVFTMRVVRHWNKLPREVVDAPTLEVFRTRLDVALSNLV